ncbi:MAG TPA: GDSL-type esterase/lipase family protein [Puia sp.]|nr:GDSL-type esterase/lipase family protein [Puia sp.]
MRNRRLFSLRFVFVFFFVTGVLQLLQAQPYSDEIRAFKKQDSVSFPPKGAILFVGSSTFRMWKDIKEDFPGFTIINRGFGGSSIPDVIRYANDIIFPYRPRQVVIYCGDNDLANSDSAASTPQVVFGHFKELFVLVRKHLPDANILYVSIKPSPARAQLTSKTQETNALIKAFISVQKNAMFVDIYPSMINVQGRPDPELFEDDRLHMNRRGYVIWRKAISPYLLK